jgi:hypothetical protein
VLAWAHLVYAAGQAHNENDLMGHTMTDFSPSNEMIGSSALFLRQEGRGTTTTTTDDRDGGRKEDTMSNRINIYFWT